MPWREVCPMDEKLRFVAAVLSDEQSVTELCASFRISRKTGYKWLTRYQEQGPEGLQDQSRAPHRVPWAISASQAEAILALRDMHPSWGPKKLRAKLLERMPEQGWPATSTMGELLRRNGLTQMRKRRRRAVPNASPLSVASGANDVWSIDFKGWFRTGDQRRCDPLTISDGFSRYLLCVRALEHPDYAGCRAQLERVFAEYGLPRVIRSDNGAPFASLGAGGLSRLGVWWVKLGIAPERIEPGKPEQNGRHERMHKTLKAETATPPAASLAEQQRRFDRFRHEFNHERPHEALGQTPPAQHYSLSPRPYRTRLEDPAYPSDFQLRRVRSNGEIKWRGEKIFLSEPLIGEVVGVKETEKGDAQLYFGQIPLAIIDVLTLKPKRISNRRRGGAALFALHPDSGTYQRLKSVTYVAGLKCYLCLWSFTQSSGYRRQLPVLRYQRMHLTSRRCFSAYHAPNSDLSL
jgi:putative transposase